MTGGDAVATVVRPELESLRREALADPGAIDRFLAGRAFPLVEDRTYTFVYRGEADAVRLRHWVYGLPSTPAFTRLDGTDLFWNDRPQRRNDPVCDQLVEGSQTLEQAPGTQAKLERAARPQWVFAQPHQRAGGAKGAAVRHPVNTCTRSARGDRTRCDDCDLLAAAAPLVHLGIDEVSGSLART